ncbi:hypothetical protein CERZMDRAFT_96453 [Cercospora zeae-maydis SCOH1-5]|uniref:Uncharacterized protein n=1 Tax=Cercospora zeae-maydis SCOH1-5 TaxID=717836 RepID=A0A6A6FJL1_9PEZI|nr:hypothetical protein CERZMDRAFT_96453 [Cercospora zeae-maydis SCOH1-5]
MDLVDTLFTEAAVLVFAQTEMTLTTRVQIARAATLLLPPVTTLIGLKCRDSINSGTESTVGLRQRANQ